MMKIFIERENEHKELDFEGKAKDLLTQLDINVQTVVLTKNGELITEEDIVTNEDSIKIISVVSGG